MTSFSIDDLPKGTSSMAGKVINGDRVEPPIGARQTQRLWLPLARADDFLRHVISYKVSQHQLDSQKCSFPMSKIRGW
jgi:hypothetical protein